MPAISAIPMPLKNNQSGKRMWPFEELSLPWATWWYDAANLVLLICLLGGVLATFVIVRTGNVKEHHWYKLREQGRERVAVLESETEKARAEIAKAHERSAQLEKDSSIAKLELERTRAELTGFRLPRRLSKEQKDRIANAIKPFPPVSFFSMTNPAAEPWDFVLEISAVLKENGWDWQPYPFSGLQAIDGRPRQGLTIADHIEIQAPPVLGQVAKALADAIRDPGVMGMDDVRLVVDEKVKVMTVIVGSKK